MRRIYTIYERSSLLHNYARPPPLEQGSKMRSGALSIPSTCTRRCHHHEATDHLMHHACRLWNVIESRDYVVEWCFQELYSFEQSLSGSSWEYVVLFVLLNILWSAVYVVENLHWKVRIDFLPISTCEKGRWWYIAATDKSFICTFIVFYSLKKEIYRIIHCVILIILSIEELEERGVVQVSDERGGTTLWCFVFNINIQQHFNHRFIHSVRSV